MDQRIRMRTLRHFDLYRESVLALIRAASQTCEEYRYPNNLILTVLISR